MLPEIVASPDTITANSSARDKRATQCRISSGASTMPRNTLAATAKPQAPEMPNNRCSPRDIPPTSTGSTRQ